ncbi:hypothetical protein CEN45_15975 [Fischerella thermalis CCMEE 5198]|uniref:hypothetical protein n=1 Tax=Fischerella thermalis TaxID=372787 RepID=UPI000CC71669|nr:hypothetical protein [Fischerella thermalis]PMB01681.1 hypothetical protein CI594_08940 [Fischerella thermalis CCMEE 5196]PMB20914.1 hypothetical protein CEN45_15975 [Fischerella thermalis CCMEE 5198]PMB52326.1 hypothetical protein CEN39_10525 [Fischerella thermalis CCMEE 5201]
MLTHNPSANLPFYVQRTKSLSPQNLTARNQSHTPPLVSNGSNIQAIAQIKAALTYSHSFRVVRSASRLFLLNSTLLLLRKTTPDT